MMKYYFTLLKPLMLIAFQILIWVGCSEQSQGASEKYTIKGEITNVDRDSIGLYDYVGAEPILLKQVAFQKSDRNGSFVLDVEVESEGVYLLAMPAGEPQQPQQPGAPKQGKQLNGFQILLGKDKKISITADAQAMEKSAVITGSPENTKFKEFNQKTAEFQNAIRAIQQQMQNAGQSAMGALQEKVDSLYAAQADYHADLAKNNDLVGQIAKIFYYAPYGYGDSKQKYASEEEYFPKSFFSKVDFKDPINGYVPIYFYKMNNYAQVLLMQYGYDYDKFTKTMDEIIAQTPPKSKARKSTIIATLGAAEALQRYNSGMALDLFVHYCKKYLADFPKDPRAEHFRQIVQQYGKTVVGELAQDIELESTEGKIIKLSSLKGKVVLVDFWASWCGPCRKENPNVVRVYNEYKDKGFDVYSVSLDNAKDRWVDAIKADNLTWKNHVSDLKGWQSVAAKAWGVTSIPKTFLIGKDGKILAKDLRGEQLELKLKEVLGGGEKGSQKGTDNPSQQRGQR
jgi:thiol-disulfide isomerase/thioredoxin